MSESPITPEQLPIDEPDLDNLDPWLEKYITKPLTGMKDKTHPDGTPYSPEEQLAATRGQLAMFAREMLQTKRVLSREVEIIKDILVQEAQRQQVSS